LIWSLNREKKTLSGKIIRLPETGSSTQKLGSGSAVLNWPPRPTKRTICITSGKGGVGKSNLVVNLAIALSRLGEKVLILDADLSLANDDLLLGLDLRGNLQDVLAGRQSIEDIVIDGPEGVKLIPASSGAERMADLSDVERERIYRLLSSVESHADVILIDTSPGLTRQTTSFALASDEVIVVTTPEPPSVSDAYAMIKLLASHRLRASVSLVVNMVSSPEEAQEVIQRIAVIASRSLGAKVEGGGYVCFDRSVMRAVQMRVPYVVAFPYSLASYNTHRLAQRISLKAGGGDSPSGSPANSPGFDPEE